LQNFFRRLVREPNVYQGESPKCNVDTYDGLVGSLRRRRRRKFTIFSPTGESSVTEPGARVRRVDSGRLFAIRSGPFQTHFQLQRALAVTHALALGRRRIPTWHPSKRVGVRRTGENRPGFCESHFCIYNFFASIPPFSPLLSFLSPCASVHADRALSPCTCNQPTQ
jgi:hypothetical protein